MKFGYIRTFVTSLLMTTGWAFFALTLAAAVSVSTNRSKQNENVKQLISCDSNRDQVVRVGAKSITILSFPAKPKEIVPGENVFDFHRIGNDLVIKALKPSASTSVLIYLAERRCAFQLKTVLGAGDGILTVDDREENLFEATFK